MKSEFLNCCDADKPTCRLHHRFVFWSCNLHEITSIQVDKFHAGFKQPVDNKDGYFWGRYELLVCYRRYNIAGEIRQKRFTRGFFFKIPYSLAGFKGEEHGETAVHIQRKYTCKATYSHQITPLFLILFPLFSRVKHVPFKVVVHVYGIVNELSSTAPNDAYDTKKDNEKECRSFIKNEGPVTEHSVVDEEKEDTTVEEQDNYQLLDYKDTGNEESEGVTEKEQQAEEDLEEIINVNLMENNETIDLDLIALDKIEDSGQQQTEPTQNQTCQIFYNMLRQHQESINLCQDRIMDYNRPAAGKSSKKVHGNKGFY
ncbi:MAG: hypothetical protein AB1796_05090 [Bacillota bacterium]